MNKYHHNNKPFRNGLFWRSMASSSTVSVFIFFCGTTEEPILLHHLLLATWLPASGVVLVAMEEPCWDVSSLTTCGILRDFFEQPFIYTPVVIFKRLPSAVRTSATNRRPIANGRRLIAEQLPTIRQPSYEQSPISFHNFWWSATGRTTDRRLIGDRSATDRRRIAD